VNHGLLAVNHGLQKVNYRLQEVRQRLRVLMTNYSKFSHPKGKPSFVDPCQVS
jgi:hypothetical protein